MTNNEIQQCLNLSLSCMSTLENIEACMPGLAPDQMQEVNDQLVRLVKYMQSVGVAPNGAQIAVASEMLKELRTKAFH